VLQLEWKQIDTYNLLTLQQIVSALNKEGNADDAHYWVNNFAPETRGDPVKTSKWVEQVTKYMRMMSA